MATFELINTLLREAVGRRQLLREPEPDLVMDGEEEVLAYTAVGRVDGPMAAAYLFHAARISLVLQGARNVVDLACGPATQLCRVAQLNPDIDFTGIDLSPGMLGNAEKFARDLGLKNVRFAEGNITRLSGISDGEVEGVMSTVALHHLPDLGHLQRTFREVRRILCSNGALYLADFGRLKSPKSVKFFAYKDIDSQPRVFCQDYENSLKAAFLFEEFKRLAQEELSAQVRLYKTFPIPFFTLIKSQDRAIADSIRKTLVQKRLELSPRYRADLDDIRRFFRMGGLANDPFR